MGSKFIQAYPVSEKQVNTINYRQTLGLNFGIKAGVILCLFSSSVFAQDSGVLNESLLAFDTAGVESRKLQIQLAKPLTLQAAAQSNRLDLGGSSLFAGTSLQWMATDNLGIGASIEKSTSQVQFQPVGSIHCQNGVLEAGSYRASDCYFTNDSNNLNMGVITIGAEYEFGNSAIAAISMFQQESSVDLDVVHSGAAVSPVLDAGLRAPALSSPFQPGFNTGSGLDFLDTSVTGIDLAFNVGVSTDNAGDMQLGFQFTHMLDGTYDGISTGRAGYNNWTLAEPFDSASVSFDWQKNSFSGGVQGFYRDQVEFLNRESLDSSTTFEVYFTWRAPWNASLSVGASNVLNSGADEPASGENTIIDPFEAVYGRIPYVRYQQDL